MRRISAVTPRKPLEETTRRFGETTPPRASGGLTRALRDHRESWLAIAGIVVLGIFAAVLEGLALVILVPLAETVASDSVSLDGRAGDLLGDARPSTLVVVGVVSVVLAAGSRVIATFTQVRLVRRLDQLSKERAFLAYLRASGRTQQGERAGRLIDTMNRAGGRSARLGNAIGTLQNLVSVAVLLIGAVVVQPAGAVIILGVGVGLFFLFRPVIVRSRAASGEATAASVPMAEHVAEIEAGRVEVRVFGAETWATRRHEANVERLTAARTRHALLAGVVTPLYQSTALVGLFAVLAFARSNETIDVASLGAVALLLLRSLSYGQAFQSTYQKLNDAGAVSDLFFETVHMLEEHAEQWGRTELDRIELVELDDVSFSYDDKTMVLDSVNVSISAGERIGLVGPSGAGKTTLAQLLLRMVPPRSGAYRVNGRPVAEYEAESWTREVAIVPQRPHLLHGTVHQNIAMFRDGVDRGHVEEAARRAGLHDVITTLPQGYDTPIGTSTRSISGGQVQRLGIARALVAEPSLLILDEPTSALDVESDRVVQEAIANLPRDTTVVLIAHRMSTLQVCDRIVVMEDGVVTQDGPPSEVALESRYFETPGPDSGHGEPATVSAE